MRLEARVMPSTPEERERNERRRDRSFQSNANKNPVITSTRRGMFDNTGMSLESRFAACDMRFTPAGHYSDRYNFQGGASPVSKQSVQTKMIIVTTTHAR